MAALPSILSSALTSLAAQRGLASHNIDDANNPDCARQMATR